MLRLTAIAILDYTRGSVQHGTKKSAEEYGSVQASKDQYGPIQADNARRLLHPF
jgi:hypothetical protein